VLVPREMPFTAIQLENMLKLARLGAVIMPPQPAFYHKPKKLDDAIDFVIGKIIDVIGLKHKLFKRWGG
jgi:4-hydroxy-3-polyprenylbenzoate decarboxylase